MADARPCESNGECKAPTPVCKISEQVCVECDDNPDCPTERRYCDTSIDKCVECQVNAQCDSTLCLAGTCASSDDITYVSDSGTDNVVCSKAMPCQNLEQALKPERLRKYIKVIGRISDDTVATIDDLTVSIFGDPQTSSITRSSNGIVLEIKKSSKVTIVDLEIKGSSADSTGVLIKDAPGPTVSMTRVAINGHQGGILVSNGSLVLTDSSVFDNDEIGIEVSPMGGAMPSLELRRSSVYLNRGTSGVMASGLTAVTIESSIIARNTGMSGGASIMIGRNFSMTNSIISANGDAIVSTVGGLSLSAAELVFQFNTVSNNVSKNNTDVGILCLGGLRLANSIFANNAVAGVCPVEYSLTSVVGTGNMTGDPAFLEDMDPTNKAFFRIGPNSAAKDVAEATTMIETDIDGQARDDGKPDMGADEYK